ncbi:MAG: hypothetical protein RR410_04815 [Alistipes sp.]
MTTIIWKTPLLLTLVMTMMMGCGATKKQSSSESRSELSQQNHESHLDQRATSADLLFRMLDQATEQSRKSLLLQEEIPAAKAVVTIPLKNLINLPQGAGYTARSENGRASLQLIRAGDTIVATSRCDSIARRCLYMESEVFRQRTQIDSLTKMLSDQTTTIHLADSLRTVQAMASSASSEKPPAVRWLKWLSIGVFMGSIATALYLKPNLVKTIIATIKKIIR